MYGNTQITVEEQLRECIQVCNDCHDICEETILHCLETGGEHAKRNHIRIMLDCAEICHTSAEFMVRRSDFHGQVCGACADVCESCAEECERFDNDPMMQRCAQACRTCAESCSEMAV